MFFLIIKISISNKKRTRITMFELKRKKEKVANLNTQNSKV